MPNRDRFFKPRAVTKAVWTVWLWILFLALSGIYEGWAAVPQIRDMLAPFSITLSDRLVFWSVAGLYELGALTMIGVAINLAAGKHAARIGLLWAFLIDFAATAFSYEPSLAFYILTSIDIGMQAYALWLVFTAPGRFWFEEKPEQA